MRTNRPRKYLEVYTALRRDLQSGRWKHGDRMPTEAELVETFGVSRITVARAMRDLQAAGLVKRRAGSGTFATSPGMASRQSFGLLIPHLGETDIFEPICQGMMASPLARQHALLWGSSSGVGASKKERAWHLCCQYIERQVSGVFFAPLELTPAQHELNRRIGDALDDARIPNSAPTVDEREAGYREALYTRNVSFDRAFAIRLDPDNGEKVREIMKSHRPDGIVCANDRTAGKLMHSLRLLKYRVPKDVRLVGIDDVEYAKLLPVPLTTLRQPTLQIGRAAVALMLERIAQRDLPPREVRLHCELIVRESCGARRAA